MMCGGLNGCPTRTRSGCLHFDCITLGVIPDELDAISESTGAAASMSANNFILKSGRSGPFSWTRSACDSAFFISVVNVRRSRDAPLERPMLVRSFQASSMYLRRFASAFGAGSVAMTSKPRARYSAAQLAPMTPVPTMAIRRIGLLYDILVFLCVDFCVSNAGEISLRDQQRFLFRALEFGGINGAGQIREEHPVPFEIESDPDSFHQMREQNVRCRMFGEIGVNRRATNRVPAGRISAVGPIQEPILQIKLEID